MPIDPRGSNRPLLQVWLQMFSWTEKDLPVKLGERALLVNNPAGLTNEPMFCYETAVKLLYWAGLAYEVDEAGRKPKRAIAEALKFYNLDSYEVIRDEDNVNKVVIAWGPSVLLVSFRGTVNKANVKQDLQAWLVDHPPRRSSWFTRPQVHAGFLKAWTKLKLEVMDRCDKILKMTPGGKERLLIITGHSLGGAIATLAAYDLASLCKPAAMNVYVYGCPRTGNHAFANDYRIKVPNTWQVMTDRDIIPRTGKMVCIFKHVGCFAYINKQGDLRVRPSYVDMRLEVLTRSRRVKEHLCEAYRQAMVAVSPQVSSISMIMRAMRSALGKVVSSKG
eukprot:jgi/Botrbrau1/7145/Bobra.0143s0021.4